MRPEKILEIVIREMLAIGDAWRFDWGDFDGRQLRRQLGYLASWAENPTADYTEGSEFYAQTVGDA